MVQTAEFLFAIGGILLLGLATEFLGRRVILPRVTLLLIFGIIIGDEVFGLIPVSVSSRFEIITDMALMMIGFLLGGKLTLASLRDTGRQLAWISVCAALGTTVFVTLALVVAGVSLELAVLLGCIAAATAPAATLDTVLESGSETVFSRLLLAIVAVDDALALLLFSVGLALISLLNGTQEIVGSVLEATYDIGGACFLGALIGLPAAYLTGRLKPGRPILTEALGLVLVCGGAAIWLNLSYLIAVMVMGSVVANLARHHEYPFHEIENIEWPLMVLFFILAGASLDISMLRELGLVGGVYLFARTGGKLLGSWIGTRASHATREIRRWMGIALLPQAGVAIGMALLTANRLPEYRDTILSIVISTTVIFELIGPVFTRMALRHSE